MMAMVIDRFGGPEVFRMAEVETPKPARGQVLIRNKFAGVNPADWKCREGMLAKYFEYKFPFIVGFDASGVIEEVGPDVTAFKPGDWVLTSSDQGLGDWGSYAELVRASVERVFLMPPQIDFAEAATVPVPGATAWGALMDVGAATRNQTVFINGGAGGVGSFLIQLAAWLKSRIATTCRPNNASYVQSLGAELAIDYSTEDVLAALRRFAPEGIDLVIDAIGLGSLPADSARVVKRGGKIVSIETLVQDIGAFDTGVAARCGVELTCNMVAAERIPQHLAAITTAIAEGGIRPLPYEVMKLRNAGAAHERVKAGHVRGKIVLEI